jgi:transposase-like protein
MNYIKNCPKCERIQTYTTKGRLQKSILENWVCNLCSSVHAKKTYNDDIINNSVKLYEEGNSLSKIGEILKIKRDNIKKILIDKNVWVEGRDKIKKEFTASEIENILKKYEEGLSVEKISNLYGVSKTPIKRILKNEKLLRKGHSNGKKIELSEYQIKKIKDLYLNEFKNIVEIANELKYT